MSMIEKKNIGEVEVKDNQIIFTDKDQKHIYKTGLMNDPNLTDRLYAVSYTHLTSHVHIKGTDYRQIIVNQNTFSVV